MLGDRPWKFQLTDVERMRQLRSEGASVRRLAKDFETTQWMVSKAHGSRSQRYDLSEPPLSGSAVLRM